jgi:hypothetical protein
MSKPAYKVGTYHFCVFETVIFVQSVIANLLSLVKLRTWLWSREKAQLFIASVDSCFYWQTRQK